LFGEGGIDPLAGPGLLLMPTQALLQEEFVDAAAFDGDALLLVEVGLQAIEPPAAERQAQALRVGQRGGDDLGALLGRIRRGTPDPRLILQPMEPLVIEAMDPGVDRRSRDAQVLGDLSGAPPVGDGQEDLGPLDEAGLCRSRRREVFEGLTLLGGQFAERDSGAGHG
jgi:hypothetical protein